LRKTPNPPSTFVALSTLTAGRPAPQASPGARPDPKDGPPCHLCPARCCQYFALQIDTPTTPKDHDQIRWFLVHQATAVWKLEGDWYLEVRNRCKNLMDDNRCAIYETRPEICREYGAPGSEDGPCEYFTDEGTYDLYFDSAEAFEAWSRVELAKREERLARRRRRYQEGRPAATAAPLHRRATG
jgi:Fe-S-cluster containining protein